MNEHQKPKGEVKCLPSLAKSSRVRKKPKLAKHFGDLLAKKREEMPLGEIREEDRSLQSRPGSSNIVPGQTKCLKSVH